MTQTIAQVDPIALRQKLKKLGIGAGSQLSGTFAEYAVRECLKWGRIPETQPAGDTLPASCPTLRLEPAELAYCLDAWSRLWEAPA